MNNISDKINNDWVVNKNIKEMLEYEFSLINPNIVICGSQDVYDFAKNIFGVDKYINEIIEIDAFESGDKIFIKFKHPACRGEKKNQFVYAKKIFKELSSVLN
jgi:hypothetical protein